jgi:hypothetical protein
VFRKLLPTVAGAGAGVVQDECEIGDLCVNRPALVQSGLMHIALSVGCWIDKCSIPQRMSISVRCVQIIAVQCSSDVSRQAGFVESSNGSAKQHDCW